MKTTKDQANKIICQNKSLSFNYEIVQRIQCGIVLLGSEVKSLRRQSCNINASFVGVGSKGVFLYNMHIPKYKFCFNKNLDEYRERSLLIEKNQIKRLIGRIKQEKLKIFPENLFFNEMNLVKVTIALVKVIKKVDRREKIKEKELKKDINREVSKYL